MLPEIINNCSMWRSRPFKLRNCTILHLSTHQPHTHTHIRTHKNYKETCQLTLPSDTQIEKETGLLKVRGSIFEELH